MTAEPLRARAAAEAGPSTEIATRDGLAEKLAYAQELANANIVPKAYQRNPGNILFAMEYGSALGVAPVHAMGAVHVIEGTPTASAKLIGALVRRAGHRLRVWDDGKTATAVIIRRDDPEFEFRAVWDMERAKQAELLGKQNWRKYPAGMRKSRAITECARDACPEALLGLHYTADEMGAEDTDEDGMSAAATMQPVAEAAPAAPSTDADSAPAGSEPEDAVVIDADYWRDQAAAATTMDEFRAVWKAANATKILDQDEQLRADLTVVGEKLQPPKDAEPASAAEPAPFPEMDDQVPGETS